MNRWGVYNSWMRGDKRRLVTARAEERELIVTSLLSSMIAKDEAVMRDRAKKVGRTELHVWFT